MAWQRWTLYDPTTDTTLTFDINPKEGGDRNYEKTLSTVSTCAPGSEGRTILAEGRDKPGEITFKGRFRSIAARNTMVEWFDKRTQVLRTVDYGEQDWIYIDKLNLSRRHVVSIPYKADYDMHAYVLDIPVTE